MELIHYTHYLFGFITLLVLLLYAIYTHSLINGLRDNDGFFHIVCAKEFRIARGIPLCHSQYRPGRVVPYTYPPLLHALLSVFVDRLSLRGMLLLPLFFTLTLACTVGLVIWHLGGNMENTALGILIFLATPSNIKGAVAITPRQLGILFFFLFFIFWPSILPKQWNAFVVNVILMSIPLALLLLSHRMGSQLAVICTIVSVLISDTIVRHIVWASSCWILAIIIAIALSRGQYIRVLLDHLHRLTLHFKYGPQSGEPKRFGRLQSILGYNPFVLTLPILLYQDRMDHLSIELSHVLMVASSILAISYLWIWGSGERHAIFLTPFMPILIVRSDMLNHNLTMLLIMLTYSILLDFYYLYRQHDANILPDETIEAYNWIRLQSTASIFAVLPKIASPAFVYFTGKKICAYPHDAGAMEFNRLTLRKNILDPIALSETLRIAGADGLLIQNETYSLQVIDKMGFSVSYKNKLWIIAECNVSVQ